MLNGTVLDVAVGLIFVFAMLSVCCSLLNERIQSVLDKRARMLEDALRALLGDDSKSPFFGVKAHALIRTTGHARSGMPSYIPSSTFVQALFDTLVPADGEHPVTFKRLRDAILRLPETSRTVLLALTSSAEGDLAAARASIERWFDHAMDRLSGAYKRHINVWLLVLGFVVAAATNADSILLVQRLEHEGALRAQVTARAEHAAAAGQKPAIDPAQIDQIEQMDLLFWDTECLVTADEAASHPRAAREPELSLAWAEWLGLKIIGCLMTALAVSLGAPFWFELLGRVVNLRATGIKPVKAPSPSGAG